MGLNSFVSRELRALPIFVLADTSGSMKGEKINQLNLALREMVNELKGLDDIRGKFQLSVISFGGATVKVLQQLADIDKISLLELTAAGKTPMGQAFEVVKTLIEDRNYVSSRSYAPTIVLISDGIPTDCPPKFFTSKKFLEWEPLQALHQGERSSKSQRLALGIGDDAEYAMLKAFINNPEIPVIKAKEAAGIAKFFKWVTMSTVARMNSVNPNETAIPLPPIDLSDEEFII